MPFTPDPPPEELPQSEDIGAFLSLISMWSLLDPSRFYAYRFGLIQLYGLEKNLRKFFVAIGMYINVSFPMVEFLNTTTEDQILHLMQEISVEQAVTTDQVTQERHAQYDLVERFCYESSLQDLSNFTLQQLTQLYEELTQVIKMVNCVYRATLLRSSLFITAQASLRLPVQSLPTVWLIYESCLCPLCRHTIIAEELQIARPDQCRDCCPICLESPKDPCVTPCKHVFCVKCLKKCFIGNCIVRLSV